MSLVTLDKYLLNIIFLNINDISVLKMTSKKFINYEGKINIKTIILEKELFSKWYIPYYNLNNNFIKLINLMKPKLPTKTKFRNKLVKKFKIPNIKFINEMINLYRIIIKFPNGIILLKPLFEYIKYEIKESKYKNINSIIDLNYLSAYNGDIDFTIKLLELKIIPKKNEYNPMYALEVNKNLAYLKFYLKNKLPLHNKFECSTICPICNKKLENYLESWYERYRHRLTIEEQKKYESSFFKNHLWNCVERI